jgi:heme exporter protein A
MSVAVEPSAPASAMAVEAAGLWHRYAPGRGLETVSFSVAAPGAVAVTGVNGSGKSTLLRIMAGLLRPSGGTLTVRVAGRPLTAATRRHAVGYAGSDLMFYEELSASENLSFAGRALGLEQPHRMALEALTRVGLERYAGDRVGALSSGMKQRLRLAFALLHRPALLLLDEPGRHLDEEGGTLVRRIVEAQRREGMVVIATNDERESRLAEQRIELRGRGLGHPA